MSLTANIRKSISKRYIDIPQEIINDGLAIDQITDNLANTEEIDDTYRTLFQGDNELVESYQQELSYLSGRISTVIIEQNFLDSAIRLPGNFFYPNVGTTPTPNLADGVWKQLKSYAKNLAVGKTYSEVYSSQDSEPDKTNVIQGLTSSIQSSYSQNERQTGTPDIIGPPFNLPLDLQSLKDAVDAWETWLEAQKTALQGNTDSTQTSQIAAALGSLEDSLNVIQAWEALADYSVGGKVDDSGLNLLNNEIAIRVAFVPTRVGQVESRLGDVNQISSGSVTLTGLYGSRYINIDSRLNSTQGTLVAKSRLELGIRALTEKIQDSTDYFNYIEGNLLVASKLTIDANGTNIITISDGTLFEESDSIFLVSDNQIELSGSISSITGNVVTLDFNVTTQYTIADNTRLVKEV